MKFAGGILALLMAAAAFLPAATPNDPGDLRQLITGWFPRWDRNRDGILQLQELDAVIESPQAQGREAAAAAAIRRHFIPGDNPLGVLASAPPMAKARLFALADEGLIREEYAQMLRQIGAANRDLFLPNDPSLLSFNQGHMGDCYFLGTVGALINRNPQAVRAMFLPLAGGSVKVSFPAGKSVVVPNITDAEVVNGAKAARTHGMWLNVLEKAYAATVVAKQRGKASPMTGPKAGSKTTGGAPSQPSLTSDIIGQGGDPGPVIELLTGHRAKWVQWERDTKEIDKTHELLSKLFSTRALVTSGTFPGAGKPLPKDIPGDHLFGVLSYDPGRKVLRMFNPWGNDYQPAGPAGLVNGYSTRHGVFDIPLAEFVQTFCGVHYETGEPVRTR